jgi:NADPH:quinone reductase-like Zn-dependent oxidoreductase
MKAIVLGTKNEMMLADLPHPVIKADEVLVKVKAISINPVDTKIRASAGMLGYFFNRTDSDAPIILGWDISGVVTAVGPDVRRFRIGDHVFGMVNFPGEGKAYAEYVAAPEAQLTHKPSNISFEEAAGAALAALTAWQSVVTAGKVKAGDKVVILAAAGGVGHYAVQIAKHFGAYVIGVGSGANRDFVLGLGADEFIDYKTHRFEEVVTDADIVHDAIDYDPTHLDRSLKALKPSGTLLSLLTVFDEGFVQRAQAKNILPHRVMVGENEQDLESIAVLLASGQLKTFVTKGFAFDQMESAHQYILNGHTRGKLVISLP